VWKLIKNFFRRVFGMQIIPTAPNLNSRMRKFRFIVLNNGPEGQMSMREQPQIGIAPSPQYLIQLYAASGDKIRILEELPPDGETASYGKMDVSQMVGAEQTAGWAAKGSLGAGKMMTTNASEDQIKALEAMHSGNPQPSAPTQPQQQVQGNVQSQQQVQHPPSQPTFFKIGSIECKMENGKVYQKQWMRVSETEMENYRLISDKNNKILPMIGKHLEVLKWAISEDDPANS
jgi:hypothetical protein